MSLLQQEKLKWVKQTKLYTGSPILDAYQSEPITSLISQCHFETNLHQEILIFSLNYHAR